MTTTGTDGANGAYSTNSDNKPDTGNAPQHDSTSAANQDDKKRKAAAISPTPLHENDNRRRRPRPSTAAIAKTTAPVSIKPKRKYQTKRKSKEAAKTNLPVAAEGQQQSQTQQQQHQNQAPKESCTNDAITSATPTNGDTNRNLHVGEDDRRTERPSKESAKANRPGASSEEQQQPKPPRKQQQSQASEYPCTNDASRITTATATKEDTNRNPRGGEVGRLTERTGKEAAKENRPGASAEEEQQPKTPQKRQQSQAPQDPSPDDTPRTNTAINEDAMRNRHGGEDDQQTERADTEESAEANLPGAAEEQQKQQQQQSQAPQEPSTDDNSRTNSPTNADAIRNSHGVEEDQPAERADTEELAEANRPCASNEQQQLLQQQLIQQQLLYQLRQQQIQQQWIQQQRIQQQWIQRQQSINQLSISFYAVKPCPGILEEPAIFFGSNDFKKYIPLASKRASRGNLQYQQFNNLAVALEYLHTPTATTTEHGNTNTTNSTSSGNAPRNRRKTLSSQTGTNPSPRTTARVTTTTKAPATSNEPSAEEQQQEKASSIAVQAENEANHQGLGTTPNDTAQQKDSSHTSPRIPTRGKFLSLPMRANNTKAPETSTESSIRQQDAESSDFVGFEENLGNHEGLSHTTNDMAQQKDSSLSMSPRTPIRGKMLSLPMRTNMASSPNTFGGTVAAAKAPATSHEDSIAQQQQEEEESGSVVERGENLTKRQSLKPTKQRKSVPKSRQPRTRKKRPPRRKPGPSNFDKKLAELKAFKEEYGHLEPPVKTHLILRHWLGEQRRRYFARQEGKKSTITLEEIVALTNLGFSFTSSLGVRRKTMQEYVTEYVEFVKKHGRFPKRAKDDHENRLHRASLLWRQRQKLYTEHGIEEWPKLGTCIIPQEHIDTLNSIDFNWDIKLQWKKRGKKRNARPFEVSIELLKAYKAKHGHCEPPKRHPKLGRFVLQQRQEYKAMIEGKRSNMTMEKFRLLSELDFRFKMGGPGHPRKRYVDDGSSGYDTSDDEDESGDDEGQRYVPQRNDIAQFEDAMSD